MWGVTPYEFASCSSSLLWTLVLAPFGALTGVRDYLPLLFNIAASCACISIVSRTMSDAGAPLTAALWGVGVMVLGTPLAWLTVIGMEHALHAAVALALLLAVARALERGPAGRAESARIGTLALLVGAARFEGLFQVLWSSVLLWKRGLRSLAAIVALTGALPTVAYGVASVSAGSLFFPNSVYLKGNIPGGGDRLRALLKLFGFGLYKLAQNPFLAVLVGAAALLLYLQWRRRDGVWDRFAWGTLVFLGVAAMQLHFAGTGMFFTRYASYLVVLGVAATVPHALRLVDQWEGAEPLARSSRRAAAALIGLALCTAPFVQRGVSSALTAAGAMGDIYRQQYQTGRFLAAHYPDQSVVINDIGAPTYLADVRVLDIWGLASVDVARAIKAGTYGPEVIERLARERGARIAIIYPGALDAWGGVPSSWRLVATATLERPTIITPTVGFYALRPSEAPALRRAVRRYAERLPKGARVSLAD